jgi:hypothetical protein
MPKITRETLRQMIAEEITRSTKPKPKEVKITAEQLRSIILQEVNQLSEQAVEFDVDAEDTAQLKVRSIADVLETAEEFSGEANDPYGYAVDDEGVYVISKGGKNLKNAIRLDPSVTKGALAISRLARANRNNQDVNDLLNKDNDYVQLARKTLGKVPMPQSVTQLIAHIEKVLKKGVEEITPAEMVANNVVMKALQDATKDPKFGTEVEVDFSLGKQPKEEELELLLPKLRGLKNSK